MTSATPTNAASGAPVPHTFSVGPGAFLLDGRPFQILAGGMHYFRVVPEYWPARLRLIRAMGLNCVDTYVPWNFHEPKRGEYWFDGLRNLEQFLQEAQTAGLYAIVRPGPYICSEWDNGGLPAWLLAEDGIRLRCSDSRFIDPLERWFDELIPRLARHQVIKGGNVIAVQVENDYARYGSDARYMDMLCDGMRRRGLEVPFYLCDAPAEVGVGLDRLTGVVGSVWLESEPEAGLAALKRRRPDDPPFCSELVCGPIQHWGEPLQSREAATCAAMLDRLVGEGASLSLYMAHGGTNFGLWNGANSIDGNYQPAVTSYDYDSPIDERGAPTEKFRLFRDVLAKYADLPPQPVELPAATLPAGSVAMMASVKLLDAECLMDTPLEQPHPATFEQLGQQAGFVLYRTQLDEPPGRRRLSLEGLRDRAQVFVDGQEIALLERGGTTGVDLDLAGRERLDLLVESLGRVNFAPDLGEHKGIVGGVRLGPRWIHGWSSIAIQLDWLARLQLGREELAGAGPVFFRGEFRVEERADTFFGLRSWRKGCAWINGFCLGRYWERGPHRSLYVPGPLLRLGANEIVILELHPAVDRHRPKVVDLLGSHDLCETEARS